MPIENDETIRVNIRTGTSTRPPRYTQLPELKIQFIYFGEPLENNSQIILDIVPRNCKQTEINEECAICQCKFKIGDKLATLQNCNHTFHNNCIQKWGEHKQSCPLCRSRIPILET